MDKIKAAIVGCGSISDIYMSNFTSGKFTVIELIGCSDLDKDRMEEKAQKYNIKAMTFEEICADSEIELVINLTTPNAHYSITKQSLLSGKHVWSEKMIAVNLEEGEELVALANEKKLHLGVAPDTFLGASIQTAKYVVDAGLIGEPISCRASVSRDYGAFGEFLPHLHKEGAGIGFDMGGYYLTALASILGPVESVYGYTSIHKPIRRNTRIGESGFDQEYQIEVPNVLTALLKYKNGVLGTLHMNSDSILKEKTNLEIYGTDGILIMGDPNLFGPELYLQKESGDELLIPFTHGYQENSRGLGAAEMAWAILKGREHRASKEMAFHIFEMMHGIMISSKERKEYTLKSDFVIPDPLPGSYIGDGTWTRKEESALIGNS